MFITALINPNQTIQIIQQDRIKKRQKCNIQCGLQKYHKWIESIMMLFLVVVTTALNEMVDHEQKPSRALHTEYWLSIIFISCFTHYLILFLVQIGGMAWVKEEILTMIMSDQKS